MRSIAVRLHPTYYVVKMWGSEVRRNVKPQGKHPEKALTAVRVRNLNVAGRYADGNGLYLVVDPTGAKRWLLRVTIQGRRRDIGLGGLTLVSLTEAREKALAYRKIARDGGDPLAERKKVRVAVPTFREAAEQVHFDNKSSWRNAKHAQQWINTLRTFAFPYLASSAVDQIGTPDILRVLAPIWLTKPETARRVRQRMGTVFDWARAAGHHNGDNPIDGVSKGLPKQGEKAVHHAAMPYMDVPAFVEALRASNNGAMTRLAFEFLLLTATRTSEVLEAEWTEIDQPELLWTIPAARMKAGREHSIPLSKRAAEILREARLVSENSDFIFPEKTLTKPMSNMVFLMALRRMKVAVTAHGFRSSFRDWASEATNPHYAALPGGCSSSV